ncbi:hypothetical protein TNIN_379431 [Trichonephila inaurata madagascariensis]|uniref:Uncharacterized protein n=1 Tax=Trichonephila inaurata madagascariensis TaxID=2747483 RepID=A0A8X7CBG8_9ARAC|nr:hypothetical protein TNIN_379431 [Trichonephila inaurata madagascariensis]
MGIHPVSASPTGRFMGGFTVNPCGRISLTIPKDVAKDCNGAIHPETAIHPVSASPTSRFIDCFLGVFFRGIPPLHPKMMSPKTAMVKSIQNSLSLPKVPTFLRFIDCLCMVTIAENSSDTTTMSSETAMV